MPIHGDEKGGSGGGSGAVESVNGKTGVVTITKSDLTMGNVDNTSDALKPVSTATAAAIAQEHTDMIARSNLYVPSLLKGAVSGVATLDATGELTTAQIPASLLAGLKWKGVWNATTNTPTLIATPSANGDFYRTSVAGTSSAPTGSSVSYGVGDWLISNGTAWQHIVNTFNDATTVSKGVVQLAGDFAGGAASPLVAKLGGVAIPAAAPTSAGKYYRSTGVATTEYSPLLAADLPVSSTVSSGAITLGGDLGGTNILQTVKKVNGWNVGSEPTMVNQVLAVTDIGSKTLGYVGQSGGGGFVASYMRAVATAPQAGTPAAGTILLMPTITSVVGSDISLSSSIFTLKAGKTYRLLGTVGAMHIAGIAQYQWRTGPTGGSGTLIGEPGAIVSVNTATNYNATCPFAEAIYTPSSDTQVHLELISGSGLVAAGFTGLGFPSAFIEVLAGSAPITGQSVDYIFARNNTTQSITTAANQVVVINTKLEGGMALSGNTITLLAGKTYDLDGSIGSVVSSNARTAFKWRDITSGVFIGTQGTRVAPGDIAAYSNSTLNARAIITPTVNTQVQLWIVQNTVAGTIGIGDFADFPYVIVKQLGTSSVINMVGATSTTPGVAGTVPAPAIAEQRDYLRGDGTWDNMPWVAYTPTMVAYSSLGVLGTSPTLSTANTFNGLYRVVGKTLHLKIVYYAWSSAGAAVGAGAYGFTLPNGYTVDLSACPLPTQVQAAANSYAALNSLPLGFGTIGAVLNTAPQHSVMVVPIASGAVGLVYQSGTQVGYVGSTLTSVLSPPRYSFCCEIPLA